MGRGRKAIPVNAAEMQIAIDMVEGGDSKPTSRMQLWGAIAATEWAKSIGLSSQVAMLKAKSFNCRVNTPLGKKGNAGLGNIPREGIKRTRKGIPGGIVKELKVIHDTQYHGTIDRAAKGSLKSAIKLKCLDCCGFQKSEVALCTLTACPLWAFRFVKNADTLTEEGRKKINDGVTANV